MAPVASGAHLAPLLAAELWQRWIRISRRFLAKLEPRLLTAAAAILDSQTLSRTGGGLESPECDLIGVRPGFVLAGSVQITSRVLLLSRLAHSVSLQLQKAGVFSFFK